MVTIAPLRMIMKPESPKLAACRRVPSTHSTQAVQLPCTAHAHNIATMSWHLPSVVLRLHEEMRLDLTNDGQPTKMIHNNNDSYAFQHRLGACGDSLCLPCRPIACVTIGTSHVQTVGVRQQKIDCLCRIRLIVYAI